MANTVEKILEHPIATIFIVGALSSATTSIIRAIKEKPRNTQGAQSEPKCEVVVEVGKEEEAE